VCDSTFIRAHIERKYELDLDEGLDSGQRAQAWAIERMLEDHLYFAMMWFRWVDAENFAKGPAHFFDRVPESDRIATRQRVQAGKLDDLRAHGIGRHPPEKVAELGIRSIDAMAALLGDRPYLFGDRCSAVDATAFGMLAAVATPFFVSPLRAGLERHDTLRAYIDRMMGRYFPEHESSWQALVEAA
jgi:glutathione S-transferase